MPALFHSSLLYPPTYSLHIYQSFTIRGKIRFGSVPNSCSSSALCQPQLIKNFNFWEHLIEEDAFSIGSVKSHQYCSPAKQKIECTLHKIWLFGNRGRCMFCPIPPIQPGLDLSNCFHNFASHETCWCFFFSSGMLLMKKTFATRQRVIWSSANINGWQIELFYSGQIAP